MRDCTHTPQRKDYVDSTLLPFQYSAFNTFAEEMGKLCSLRIMVLYGQPVVTSLPDPWMKDASILEQITRDI